MTNSVDPAIRRLRETGQMAAIAARLKIARQAPYAWTRVPPLRVLQVARITGLQPHELRPDLYPPPSANTSLRHTGRRKRRPARTVK